LRNLLPAVNEFISIHSLGITLIRDYIIQVAVIRINYIFKFSWYLYMQESYYYYLFNRDFSMHLI